MKNRPVLFLILDGWGVREETSHNAIKLARTPNMTRLSQSYPSTTLQASGKYVGLPDGLMGNSEVGHLNIGAGRIVYQDIVRISHAIRDGSFFENEAFLRVFTFAKSRRGKVHLLGLLSDGGVHSSFDHLVALLDLAGRQNFPNVCVHAFLDGRDTPPKSALSYIARLEAALARNASGKIATVSGRYFAMDRDKRWERLEKAYRALVLSEGLHAAAASQAVEAAYVRGETDEFVEPTLIHGDGEPAVRISDGDGVIFFNFRADRARELTAALTRPDFPGFKLPRPEIAFCGMTGYDASFTTPAAFPSENLVNTLGEVWSRAGLSQFHIAETEKYAHVTYFFSGGREAPFPGEDRLLIPSSKVATYDMKPEMSAPEITEACLSKIAEDRYDCIVMNFANADMVGHTGNLEATIAGVEMVDACVGKLTDAVFSRKGLVAITADHGNAEIKFDPATGQPSTAHTTNPVPFILVADRLQGSTLESGGILADVAPTLLAAMGLPKPAEMTGRSLLPSGGKSIRATAAGIESASKRGMARSGPE